MNQKVFHAALCFFMASLCVTALAQSAPLPVALFSKGSPHLKIVEKSDSTEKGSYAKWRGHLQLTGDLVIEFDRQCKDCQSQDVGSIYFQPDKMSKAKLPAARNFYPLQPNALWLNGNGKTILKPLIGEKAFIAILQGDKARYAIPAEIHISEYSTSVECDHRTYDIEYTHIALLHKPVVAYAKRKEYTC